MLSTEVCFATSCLYCGVHTVFSDTAVSTSLAVEPSAGALAPSRPGLVVRPVSFAMRLSEKISSRLPCTQAKAAKHSCVNFPKQNHKKNQAAPHRGMCCSALPALLSSSPSALQGLINNRKQIQKQIWLHTEDVLLSNLCTPVVQGQGLLTNLSTQCKG